MIRALVLAILVPAMLAMAVLAQQTTTTIPTPAPTTASNHSQCVNTTSKPDPGMQKYNHNNCTVAQLAAYLTIAPGHYLELKDGKVNETLSKCSGNTTTSKLVIDFACGQLAFDITQETNSSVVYVATISGQYFLNATEVGIPFTNSTPAFNTTASGRYYKCNAEQIIGLGENKSLHLSKFALEAFRNTASPDYYKVVDECVLDSAPVSDLVRIGVGICLVALVAIVIVAYFIGRRRWSERSSYESV